MKERFVSTSGWSFDTIVILTILAFLVFAADHCASELRRFYETNTWADFPPRERQ